MTKRVLFLFSDTGGGHRAAAEAIRDALYQQYGQDAIQASMVDVFKQALFPLNYMPEFYPWWVNHSKTSWGVGYNLTNTKRRARVLSSGMYLTSGHRLRKMARSNPADVVVCVHSVVNRPSMRAFLALDHRPPFITVVTDLVSTHAFWYDKHAERCLVPTQVAYDTGIELGMKPEQLSVTGLPVHPRFGDAMMDKAEAKRTLGWRLDKPAILMVAGGDGMGPLYETTRAINEKRLDCQLIVVAGRNKVLKEKLEAGEWHQPTQIYGFTREMPRMMAAADILVTKAGPATISEACIAGLPMILSDAIPGQETGNVDYVVENNAGVYAPDPDVVASTVEQWLKEGEAGLRRRAENARRLGRPNAVWDIASEVWDYAHQPLIPTHRRKRLTRMFETRGQFSVNANS
ncbi:MAG: glycosyltransferase [bacterium]|nr:glycosyltransferase [bacterium]